MTIMRSQCQVAALRGPWFRTRIAIALVAAAMFSLSAKEEKEKPKERPRKETSAKPAKNAKADRGAAAGRSEEKAGPESQRPGAAPSPAPGRGMAPGSTPAPAFGPSSQGAPGFGRPGVASREGPGPQQQVVRTRDGAEIHRTPGGAISEVRTANGVVIRHAPGGARQIEMARPDGRVIVANGSGRTGYIQRPMMYGGQAFVQRTYVVNGVAYPRVYRPWSYGGRVYPIYAPMHYYRPGFYTWAYSPWGHPVQYRWGWYARPWYGYYGGYFAPYPYYAGPSFWLADFLIATTLETAYLEQNVSGAPPVAYDASSAMSPEVKQAIADEVRRQMDQERADQAAYQAGGPNTAPPPIFSAQGPKVFLVAGSVMGYDGNRECPLAEGDVLGLVQTPSPNSEWAQVRVMATRGSCPKGTLLSVRVLDLQEMQNHLQATMDQGLDKLNAEQGRGGLPAVPPDARGTQNAGYASALLDEDNALDDLSLAIKEANQSEQDAIKQGAAQPSQPPRPPQAGTTISLGMTISQVMAVLGQPRNTVDLGAKQIYLYQDLKITFLNGRVSNVQ